MAIEYQGKRWLFLPQNVEPGTSSGPVLQPDEWFTVHFLHDLESLFWVYLWFLHFRVPRRSVEKVRRGKDPKPETLIQWQRTVQRRASSYFFCSIHGNIDRVELIRDGASRIAVKGKQIFEPLYADHLQLLKPTFFTKELRKEYEDIQKQEPYEDATGSWRLPAAGITDRLYRLFEDDLKEALNILSVDPLAVQDVATMDRVAPSSIMTGTKRTRDETETGDAQNEQVAPEKVDPADRQPRSKRQKSQA